MKVKRWRTETEAKSEPRKEEKEPKEKEIRRRPKRRSPRRTPEARIQPWPLATHPSMGALRPGMLQATRRRGRIE